MDKLAPPLLRFTRKPRMSDKRRVKRRRMARFSIRPHSDRMLDREQAPDEHPDRHRRQEHSDHVSRILEPTPERRVTPGSR
jgi:hypothetical protein